MAENVRVYTEGGMPSNFQVCGVRSTRLYGAESSPLIAADIYKMFDLSDDEVVLSYGVEVITAAPATSTFTVSDGTGALTALTAVDAEVVGKTAGVITELAGNGLGADTLSVVITGDVNVDLNLYAVVARVATLETYTEVGTPAP